MNFIDLGLQVKTYNKWMQHLLSSIQKSINQTGSIVIEDLDNSTYTFNSKTVSTVAQLLNDLESQVWQLTSKVPSLNVHPDPNFNDTNNWTITGTGTLAIEAITPADISELDSLTGESFGLLNGLSQKAVVTNLPASTDPTVTKLGYLSSTTYINNSITLGGFCKIDNNPWTYITIDIVTNPINDGYIYQLNIGNFSRFELFYPSITLSSPIYGG